MAEGIYVNIKPKLDTSEIHGQVVQFLKDEFTHALHVLLGKECPKCLS